jgi:hypothetical protein
VAALMHVILDLLGMAIPNLDCMVTLLHITPISMERQVMVIHIIQADTATGAKIIRSQGNSRKRGFQNPF